MKYWIQRFSHPIRGLKYALLHDRAIQIEVVLFGIIGFPLANILFGPFSAREWLLLIFCWFFIVVTELQNSAIETALDRLHPERHEEIGRSKDMAAGAVMWAAVFGLISLIFIVSGKI
jgi:undecaprenol kinase